MVQEINKNDNSFVKRNLMDVKIIDELKSKKKGFSSTEISTDFIISMLGCNKITESLSMFSDMLSDDSYVNTLLDNKLEGVVDTMWNYDSVLVSNISLYMQMLSSDLIERSNFDSSSKFELDQFLLELFEYVDSNINPGGNIQEHIGFDHFAFLFAEVYKNNKFEFTSWASNDAQGMMEILNIFGDGLIPPALSSLLREKDSAPADISYRMSTECRSMYYSPYDTTIVMKSDNQIDMNSMNLLVEHEKLHLSCNYVYSESLDSFLRTAGDDEKEALCNDFQELFRYEDIFKVIQTNYFIVRRGEDMFTYLNTERIPANIDYLIVFGESHWYYDEWYNFTSSEILFHTIDYINKINLKLKGY